VGRRSCSTARTPPTASEPSQRPPRTLALASPRRVRDVRGEAAYHGDEAAAGGGIGGADDEPEGRAPCGTRGWAVIVVLLVLAWAAQRGAADGRRAVIASAERSSV
jgi:hypothetical protein